MNEKSGLQQKGHFSHPGQKGWCLSTTRVPDVQYRGTEREGERGRERERERDLG